MKKSWYWFIGILAVIAAAVLLWSAASRKASQSTPSAQDSGQMNHADMNHQAMDQGAPGGPDDTDLAGYLEEQDAIMDRMTQEMAAIEHFGNASADFLSGMIPHHEAAVAMAESYLEHGGSHKVLAPLAEEIIAAQTDEIKRMKTMVEELKASGAADAEQAQAYLDDAARRMDHSMAHSTAGSLNAAFAEGMILHHQMAVDMAGAILPHTEDAGVKKLAEAMSEAQEQEIGRMQAVLDAAAS